MDGTPTLNAYLILGTATMPGVVFDPFGYLRLDLTSPFFLFPLGPAPAGLSFGIPGGFPLGTRIPFQGFGASGGLGNVTNLIEFTVVP